MWGLRLSLELSVQGLEPIVVILYLGPRPYRLYPDTYLLLCENLLSHVRLINRLICGMPL